MATLFSNTLDVLIQERLGARFGLDKELKCQRSISLRSENPSCLSTAMKFISVHFPYIFREPNWNSRCRSPQGVQELRKLSRSLHL
ncbi:unnamed protein product [Porites lobata]|uniref:Uncharacterized protein n=1 Tax=Porites lobata TaxID=104759 RepID=A0ABN8RPJ6_9CNID|nr:unnamed protein product [Porites lobata]